MQRKRIAKVAPVMHGHVCLEFEDGTKKFVFRGEHEAHAPGPGDFWPPEAPVVASIEEPIAPPPAPPVVVEVAPPPAEIPAAPVVPAPIAAPEKAEA